MRALLQTILVAACLLGAADAFPAALSLVPHLRAKGISLRRDSHEPRGDVVAVALPIVKKLKDEWITEAQWQTVREIAKIVISEYSGVAKGAVGATATLTRRIRTRDLLSKLFHLDLEEEGRAEAPQPPTVLSQRETKWEASGRRRLCKSVAKSIQFRNAPPPQ